MNKRFANIKKKINNFLISKRYYVKISPEKSNNSFEEDYHFITVDPDGKKRNLLKERRSYLSKSKHIINILKKSKTGKIIDIGCGLGWFMSILSKKWDKYGTDISKFALKNAAKYCKTYNGDIEKLLKEKKIKTKFDYILFSHVIEHLKNPIFVLKELRNILKKNGTLLIETPNFDSAAFRLFEDRFRLLNDPTHISLFTNESMFRVLNDLGYKVISVDYPYFETNYFNKKNLLKILNHKKEKVSPPFYGSVMFFVCKKIKKLKN
jgi:2-polyprenyl-3-methyl-5-hydroxy-6-metoxy-1,4-benzoquinol methylase